MNPSRKGLRVFLSFAALCVFFVTWTKSISHNVGIDAQPEDNLNENDSFLPVSGDPNDVLNRKLQLDQEQSFAEIEQSNVPWSGIENAEWCQSPTEPPLPYGNCEYDSWVFRIPVYGGLTNALHFIMKGAIWAFEEEVCFYVDEWSPTQSRLGAREPVEDSISPFLERYFERIGMPKDSEPIQKALNSNQVITPTYQQIQRHEYGRFSSGLTAIDNDVRHKKRSLEILKLRDIDNILLKKQFLHRFFRILPQLRYLACSRLRAQGLEDEYMTLSVRRGDKVLEFELELSLMPYIEKAEIAIQTHFGGAPPTIFVASDDCSVMQEFRELRPNWRFVGECDNATEDNGFVIADMKMWTAEQTDRHYQKFVSEMIAMASAKYFIGVSTTNVTYWVYFMRHSNARDDTFALVDANDNLAVH
mmetsp:Transcript_26394/g.39025  ORF Transcript_26394/g.39025 Transcript_26394/m.39025 type:complete len:417 (+) Transcript_26394:75-1325(+)